MSFPRYPEYKRSGVEWLGDVPAHWEVLTLKRFIGMQSGDTIDGLSIRDDGPIPVYGGNGIRGFTDDATHEGDYALVGRQGALCGNVNYASGRFWASEHAVVVTPRRRVEVRWLGEMLRAMNLNQYSVSAAQPGLSVSTLVELRTCLPPLPEQRAIAAFLDRETAKIDGLVAEQQRLIELLKEKRQAVISHAVTKGLDSKAPMKPSGVEWLGDVPAHWRVSKGRHLFRKLDLAPEGDDEIVTIFRDGQVTLRTNRRSDGFTLATLEVGYQRIRAGDLAIHGMDAFAGAIGVSDSTGKCTPEYVVLEPIDSSLQNEFFSSILRVMARRGYIEMICPSVRERAPRFRFEAFKDVLLPVPPPHEQREILSHIAAQSGLLSDLGAESTRLIAILEERRCALISAAVTGQIDVRNAVTSEAA